MSAQLRAFVFRDRLNLNPENQPWFAVAATAKSADDLDTADRFIDLGNFASQQAALNAAISAITTVQENRCGSSIDCYWTCPGCPENAGRKQ